MATEGSALFDALGRIQSMDIRVVKDAKANYGKYATLGTIIDALRGPLSEHGLVLTQAPGMTPAPNNAPTCITQITHAESGTYHRTETPLLIDRDNMQGFGAAMTYARRYALVALFFLDADDDDDAQSLVKPVPVKDIDAAKSELLEVLTDKGLTFADDATASEIRKEIRSFTGLTAKELNDASAIRAWIAANV